MVFAVNAPGVTIRKLKLNTEFAFTAVYISSANCEASDHPVIVERNDFSVINYAALVTCSAAFPVRTNNNVLRGAYPVGCQWIGFTLRPIGSSPYDEPIEPKDADGITVRFPLEITNNRIITTPGADSVTMWIFDGRHRCHSPFTTSAGSTRAAWRAGLRQATRETTIKLRPAPK